MSQLSQNLLIKPKPAAKHELLTLNVRCIDDLFPGFVPGDFALVYGSPAPTSLASLLCVRAQLPAQLGGLSSSVVYIDGGNSFRLYNISRLAQIHHLDPKQALNRIFIARAFTAYQMTALLMERLTDAVENYHSKVVIVSDIAGLFLDKDIPDDEAKRVYSQVVASLQSFASKHQVIIIATYKPRPSNNRSQYLQNVTSQKANVVIELKQTPYDREFVLEKHPRLMLGTADFPQENLTLVDFFQRESKIMASAILA